MGRLWWDEQSIKSIYEIEIPIQLSGFVFGRPYGPKFELFFREIKLLEISLLDVK